MRYFVGLDGGGTKTAGLLIDESGKCLAEAGDKGASYRQHGMDAVEQMLAGLTAQMAGQAGARDGDIAGICIGLPLLGEDAPRDAEITGRLRARFGERLYLVNDAQVGWAGSLGCEAGINLVAGTGSIAFGCDEAGNTRRCGGWSEHFSDEGSSYWLAMRGMELFTKQADGRVPRGPFYNMVRQRLALRDDFEFVRYAEEQLLPHRDKVAAFQKLLSDAADAGDGSVLPLYAAAARELSAMALAVKQNLAFAAAPVKVSYSGGTFKAGEMLLGPFRQLLEAEGMALQTPLLTPVQGAALLAVKQAASKCFAEARAALAGLRE